MVKKVQNWRRDTGGYQLVAELRSYAKTHSYHKMIYPHWPITIRWPITAWFTLFDGNNRRPPIMCCTGRWRNGNATQCESTLSWQSTEPHKMDCVATQTSYWQTWKYIYLVTTGLQIAEWEPTLSQRTARFAVLLQLFTHVTRICERKERSRGCVTSPGQKKKVVLFSEFAARLISALPVW